MPLPPKDAPKRTVTSGSGQPNVPIEPRQDQITASALERDHGLYRMLADLQATVAVLRESVTLLRDDVKNNNQKIEAKLDTHSTEIRELMTEVRATAKVVKVFGIAIPIFIAFLTLLWAVGSKLLDLITSIKKT
jgi:hypothetical protein